MGPYLRNKLVGAEVLLGKFLGGSLGTEIMFLDIGSFPKGEVRWRHASSVCVLLKPFLGLGHLSLEIFV